MAWQQDDHTVHDRRDLLTLGIDAYTSSEIIGQPSLATEARGHAALDSLGQGAVTVVEVMGEQFSKASPKQ